MKKLILSLIASCSCLGSFADEGMWTLSNLPQAVYDKMVEEGYSLPYDQLYNDSNSIMHAVVNFGGFCSGVVVSPDGLVFTNHHCGFEAIRSHSTVEHDYMLNGFCSKSYEEELPNEGLFVSFMVSQRDVTDQVLATGLRKMSVERQEEILDSMERAENKLIRETDPTLRVELKPYYEGNSYYLTTYRDFTDVRLVFAIPKSMGKFGGETDNWMWPRQTCDFSVFRVYCDPVTGGPAEYSEKNVPYHPETWARVSKDGYKEGDFAMTMGYPGSTERYLSSFGIKEMRDCQNAPRAQVRGVKQDVMIKHMRASEAVRIKYDSKYAQSSNYWKNSLGMNKCIDSINIIGLKQSHEAAIREYQEKTGYLKGELDIDLLGQLYAKRYKSAYALIMRSESFGSRVSILAQRAQRAYNALNRYNETKDKKVAKLEIPNDDEEWDAALEQEVLVALIKNYRSHVDAEYLPAFYQTIDGKYKGDVERYVADLFTKSVLMQSGSTIDMSKKKMQKDMGVAFGKDIMELWDMMYASYGEVSDQIAEQERLLCAAKLRMEQDMPLYSDANFTLRLSYGQVGGYLLAGQPSGYYTAPQSLLDKMEQGDKVIDYYAEPIMHKLFSAQDYGKYNDPVTGTMNLCFLTNNDITGGNSGSPIFDGKNQLIGLAFDGNWDSLSSDIFFDKELARCIGVDIRYVLYMMDKWGDADRLLMEIGY